MEEKGRNLSGKQNKGSSHDQTPCNHDTERNLISLTDTVIFSGTVNFCAVKEFRAAANPSAVFQEIDSICPPTLLGSDSSWSEGRNHTCQEHGDHTVQSSLESGRYTDPANGMVDLFMADGKEMDFLQYIFVIFSPKNSGDHYQHNDQLGRNSRNGCSHNFQPREKACAEDQERIQDHIHNKTDQICNKWGFRVSLCSLKTC